MGGGANNFPLRGGKTSDWEGVMRAPLLLTIWVKFSKITIWVEFSKILSNVVAARA